MLAAARQSSASSRVALRSVAGAVVLGIGLAACGAPAALPAASSPGAVAIQPAPVPTPKQTLDLPTSSPGAVAIQPAPLPTPKQTLDLPTVAFRRLEEPTPLLNEGGLFVITRNGQLEQAIQPYVYAYNGPAPVVDFEHDMIILAAQGFRGTGGNAYKILGLYDAGDALVVHVFQQEANLSCTQTAAASYFADWIVTRRSPKPVRTEVLSVSYPSDDCGR